MGNKPFPKTILYVDDQPSHRALFFRAFRQYYEIVTAASGEEGLEIIKKKNISFVIADHNMPGMTGITFLEKVQEIAPEIQKAIVSAYLDDSIPKDMMKKLRMSGAMAKPWKLGKMKSFIDRGFADLETLPGPVVPEQAIDAPPVSDLVTDKPLWTSRDFARMAEQFSQEVTDDRSARRIFLHLVEPRLKTVFPLIRRPCHPLLREAQMNALEGNYDALEENLKKYLNETNLERVLTDIVEPVQKKVIH